MTVSTTQDPTELLLAAVRLQHSLTELAKELETLKSSYKQEKTFDAWPAKVPSRANRLKRVN